MFSEAESLTRDVLSVLMFCVEYYDNMKSKCQKSYLLNIFVLQELKLSMRSRPTKIRDRSLIMGGGRQPRTQALTLGGGGW
jgi:hypothetical protein